MIKILKAIYKWLQGIYIEPGEQRRLDELWLNIRCSFYTLIIVILIIWFLHICGVFIGDYHGD